MTPSIGSLATEKPAPFRGYPLASLAQRAGADVSSKIDDEASRLDAAGTPPGEAAVDDGFDFHLGVYAAF